MELARGHIKIKISINYDGKGGFFIRLLTLDFPAVFYQEQESWSFRLFFFFFWRGNNSNMSEIRNLYPNALLINSLFLRYKCEWTLDINVDFHTTVIYRAGFSPYQVLRESIHSVMLEPNNIEITAAEILPEWSFLRYFLLVFPLSFDLAVSINTISEYLSSTCL